MGVGYPKMNNARFAYSSDDGSPFNPNPAVIFVNPATHAMRTEAAEVGTSAAGVSWFRAGSSALLLAAPREIKASGGNVYGMHLLNPNAVAIFVKFFNVAAGSVVSGTTVPVHVVMVPAGVGSNHGQVMIAPDAFPLWNFSAAISVLATSVFADGGEQTAPGAGLMAEFAYA
jgi:hypothetical protein